VVVHWKQFCKEYPLRFDLLINDCLLVELKAVEAVKPIHKAQLLSYMKLVDIPLGLIINFNEQKLVDGVSRLILPGANTE
jgi:GxxExxY protein